MVFVNGILPNERVKKITTFGHVARGRGGEVAFGIHQPAAIGCGGDIKITRNKAGRAIKEREWFPTGGFVAENILARPDANDISAKRRPEFDVHLAQHLVRFVNAHG